MRKTIRLLPPLALLLGVVGAFLRHVELVDGFDPVSGLAQPGCTARWVLAAMTAVLFAALAAAAVLAGKRLQVVDSFRKAFYTKGYAAFAVMAILGIAVTLCAVLGVVTKAAPMGLAGMSKWVFFGLLALAGLGMTAMAYSAYTQRDTSFLRLGSVLPAVLYCYWLVALYRQNAGNPVLADYCYGALGFSAASMGFYYSAGYAFGRRSLRGNVLLGPGSVFLLTVCVADPWPAFLRAVLIATAVYLTVSNMQLLASLREKEPETAGEESEKSPETGETGKPETPEENG